MATDAATEYEAPKIEDHGTLVDLTAGIVTGGRRTAFTRLKDREEKACQAIP